MKMFDPYHSWLGIPPDEQPPNHYRLLGINLFESEREVIFNAADQRMVYLKTFGTGQHSELSQRLLNEVSAANVCLLNEAKKRAYDEQLRKRTSPSSAARPDPVQEPPPIAPRLQADSAPPRVVVDAGLSAQSRRKSHPRGRRELAASAAVTLLLVILGALVIYHRTEPRNSAVESAASLPELEVPDGKHGEPEGLKPTDEAQTTEEQFADNLREMIPRSEALLVDAWPTDEVEPKVDSAESLDRPLEFGRILSSTAENRIGVTPDIFRVEAPCAALPKLDLLMPGETPWTSSTGTPQISRALKGREEGTKLLLLSAYGGNDTTEAAVQAGLKWLANVQDTDGSWSLIGPYSNGAKDENRMAATAMALLAFQGNGHTNLNGEYSKNVAAGSDWLLAAPVHSRIFIDTVPKNQKFYTHGLCTIAICELLGMSKDQQFRKPAELAVQYCVQSQGPAGGWRYEPRQDGDVSVTGWILMALQSARMAGLEVPHETLKRAEGFLDSVAGSRGSFYPYQLGTQVTPSMTASALLCRQYLGWKRDDPRMIEEVKWLIQRENLIDFQKAHNVYHWYYAAKVCHHMQGEYWEKWNTVMREAVPQRQVKQGPEAGSWDPLKPRPDAWAGQGGRLYVTCFSIYILEVYYRHLPIYSAVN